MNWGQFRAQLRRSVLRDLEGQTWSDEDALNLFNWALDSFCAHTAMEAVFMPTGVTGTTVPLPADLYDSLETSGLVYITQGSQTLYLDYQEFPETSVDRSFRTWNGMIELSQVVPENSQLKIRYFAYYPHPLLDSDPLLVPQWAYVALTYSVGAISLGPVGMLSANISQWKDRSDSGNPEHNALRAQQQWLQSLYETELAKMPRQPRAHYWKRESE